MNYRLKAKQLKDVRRQMIAEIPRYWESRIDKMMLMVPEAMLNQGVELYMNRDIYEMMNRPKEYNGIKTVPGPGIPEDYMMITERKNLYLDEDWLA